MTNTLISALLSLILGSVVMVNGAAIDADEIVANAKSAANGANLHQIATVLELYYSDFDHYPDVEGGEKLIEALEVNGYIMNRPLDPSIFIYKPSKDGQDYTLKLK